MELLFYEDGFESLINQYELTEEQLRYTNTPKNCIELSKEDADRYSILALEDHQLVTFFVLHRNEGVKPYSSNERAILLRGFSTDFRHLGNGYAKKSLTLLPDFVRGNFKDINEIVLAVNTGNEIAQELYKKCGFIDEGERRMGSKGELLVLSYHL
ncbi:GNAT family protein [Bacillus sp. 31A1R]|uniref:GNAT family protein n=1 Tax=Robertmurraya mangrovi TaxID=3098077 RepID=A0ABU5J0Y8_9BACI|nr:GNAT family protein [Bacillus sp. 31A1R]MDZ5473088.1 GNAT family protein [Bacillus sp. 31A1R]